MPRPDWRVYLDGGATAAGSGPPTPAVPAGGAVCVVQRDPESGGPHLLTGHDWYWYDPLHGQWFGGDVHGMVDFVVRCGLVRQGRFVPNAEYDRTCAAARTDPDFAGPAGREHYRPARDAETRG